MTSPFLPTERLPSQGRNKALGNSHSLGSYSRGSLSQWAWDFGGMVGGHLIVAFFLIFAGLFV